MSYVGTKQEAPPTGCEGPRWGLWESHQRLWHSIENESGKQRRLVRPLEKEGVVKYVFFFLIIPTLKHTRTWLEGPPVRKARKESYEIRRHLKRSPRENWQKIVPSWFLSSCSQRLSEGSVAFLISMPFKGIPLQPRIGQIPEDTREGCN